MTWLLLVRTGWLIWISNQWVLPYCHAHAVANCMQAYWETYEPNKLAESRWFNWILPQWRDVRSLKKEHPELWLWEIYWYSNHLMVIELLNKWPLLIYRKMSFWRHAECVAWYNWSWYITAGSYWERYGTKWYTIIPYNTTWLFFQTLWSKTLTPSLITLTEKKGGSLGSGQTVKSPTINKKNTRKKYLKRLD